MTAHTVPSGTYTFSSTLAANAADSVSFGDRAGFVRVVNTGSTVLYTRADGQVAAVAAEGCLAVAPGETELRGNGLPLWYQSADVIPQGANQFGNGNTADSPSSPGEVQSQRSLAGQMANPGTTVSIISAAADTYTLALAG